MPEKDISGQMVDKASNRLLEALVKVDKQMPIGPAHEQLSDAETRAKLQGMSIEERREVMEQMGEEKFLELLKRLFGRG